MVRSRAASSRRILRSWCVASLRRSLLGSKGESMVSQNRQKEGWVKEKLTVPILSKIVERCVAYIFL